MSNHSFYTILIQTNSITPFPSHTQTPHHITSSLFTSLQQIICALFIESDDAIWTILICKNLN